MSRNVKNKNEGEEAEKRPSIRRSILGLFSADTLRNKFKQRNDKFDPPGKNDKLDHSFLTNTKRRGSSQIEELGLFNTNRNSRRSRRSSTLSNWSKRSKRSSSVFSIDREVYDSIFELESVKSQVTQGKRDSMDYSMLGENDGNNCVICLSQESVKNRLMSLPCSNKCNMSFVHLLCIYEWKMKCKDTSTGTCPLCRSNLTSISYTPPDLLQLKKLAVDSQFRKEFVLSSIPRSLGIIKAFLKVTFPTPSSNYIKYEMFLQFQDGGRFSNYPFGSIPTSLSPGQGDVCLLTAFKCKLVKFPFRAHLRMNLSEDQENCCRNWTDRLTKPLIGYVRHSGLLHLSFRTLAVKKESSSDFNEVGLTVFAQNRTGEHRGPRKIRVALCAVTKGKVSVSKQDSTETGDSLSSTGKLNKRYTPVETEGSLGHIMRDRLKSKHIFTENFLSQVYSEEKYTSKGFFFGKNKDPAYMEEIGGYSLDFNGRVTLPSNKNFQLILGSKENQSAEKVSLQFGKVDQSDDSVVYTLDICWPFSPVQAFGVALCSCDWKLGCS